LEELQDYGSHASKVAWPILTTQVFRDLLDVYEHALRLGIHFLIRKREDVIDPVCRAERHIVRQDPRIEIVIAFLIELNWIDKETRYNG
jgi:hypothetical protein